MKLARTKDSKLACYTTQRLEPGKILNFRLEYTKQQYRVIKKLTNISYEVELLSEEPIVIDENALSAQ